MVAIHLMMERRYPTKQGWLLFNEVRNKTGFGAGPEGFCDAMALSIWPSRGIALHGFEMKASRSDLIAELNQPAKADPFVRYCNFWWLVVEDAKLIEGLEIPQNWGILAPKTGSLREIRPAPKLNPEPWKPVFIASLLRNFHANYIEKPKLSQENEARIKASELAKSMVGERESKLETELERMRAELKLQRETMRRFELATGLSISHYNAGDIAAAVRMVMHGSMHGMATRLKNLERIALDLADMAKTASEAVSAIRSRNAKADSL